MDFIPKPVAPVAPVLPLKATENEKFFVKDFPSTVIGTVSTPCPVVNEEVTDTVNEADVVPLLEMLVDIPDGAPVIVPIVAATLVAPLYAITSHFVDAAMAALVVPWKACDSLPRIMV